MPEQTCWLEGAVSGPGGTGGGLVRLAKLAACGAVLARRAGTWLGTGHLERWHQCGSAGPQPRGGTSRRRELPSGWRGHRQGWGERGGWSAPSEGQAKRAGRAGGIRAAGLACGSAGARRGAPGSTVGASQLDGREKHPRSLLQLSDRHPLWTQTAAAREALCH